jgi:hypothetical protein
MSVLKTRSCWLVAIFAVNRLVAGRLEGYFSSFSTPGACSPESFARLPLKPAATTASTALLFMNLTARGATRGLVGKTFGSIKLLFTGRENKLISTVTTCYCFILVHYRTSFSKELVPTWKWLRSGGSRFDLISSCFKAIIIQDNIILLYLRKIIKTDVVFKVYILSFVEYLLNNYSPGLLNKLYPES